MNVPLRRTSHFLRRFKEQTFRISFGMALLGLILVTSQSALAATYTVTNTSDSGTGSLRDAITQVNAGGGGDTINFSGVTGTITVGSTLTITETVTINGPGANILAISGNDAVRVFAIAPTAANTVISGLTITHGNATSPTIFNGAGINSSAALTVNNCTFSYNKAGVLGGLLNVGAAIVGGAALTVNSSTFYNNQALNGDGGAIYTATTLVVNDSTFFNNSAVAQGGAIWEQLGTHLTLRNNTIVGNTVTQATVSGSGGTGGGVWIDGFAPAVSANNIISGNTAAGSPDYSCTVSCGTTPAGNLIGNATITSLLTPLQYNGGPTMTMLPLSTGAGIIGAGLNSTLATDQRGFARPTSGASDLGAVQTYNLVVTTTTDSTDGASTCDGSDTCSLRDAINLANSHGAGDIVTVTGLQGTIGLTSALPNITTNLNIDGPGANQLTISGGNTYPVFHIANSGTANISGVTIANGNSGSPGGAGITNLGTLLTLSSCEVNNNHAAGQDGGALFNSGVSTATVTDCTFSGNSSDSGGAINNDGVLSVTNSTFFGNTAQADFGGGIFNQLLAIITNSTITGNTATSNGGGIENIGTITVNNSIVAGNTEAGSPNGDCGSCGTQSSSNLISFVGTPVTATQTMLAPLAYYGLNQAVRTMLPLPGSPVIQAGDPTQLPPGLTTDERLLPRIINSKLDLGAVETNYTSIQFVQQPSNTTVNATMIPPVTMSVTESGTTVANVPLPIIFSGSGALHGTLTESTVAPTVVGDPALASFANLSGDTVGTGDTLTSTVTVTPAGVSPAQTLTATSNPFDITALTPVTVSITPAPPTSVVYGSAPITLNGTVNALGTPTGQTITYQVASGPGSIAGNSLSFGGVGTVTVNASTAASGSYAAGSSLFNIAVTPAPLTITVGNAARSVGAANPEFTSTASGLVNGDTLGGSIFVAYSTTATTGSPAGSYPISATISGPAAGNYTVTIVHGTLTVTAQTGASQTVSVPTVTVGPTSPTAGQSVILTATVPKTGTAVPTGTVTFYYNGTPIGTGTLNASGVATLTTSALPVGTGTVTVSYSGDSNYTSSPSAPVSINVAAATVLDFTLQRTSAQSQTIITGQAATITLQVAPTNGTYPGNVSFTATGLPSGATATFTPATIAANGGTASVNLNVQTAPLTSANRLSSTVAPIALGVLLLPFLGAKRKKLIADGRTAGRYLLMVLVLLAGAVTMAGLTGCADHNGFFGHAPATYNITITATSGTIQHSVNATLNVQ